MKQTQDNRRGWNRGRGGRPPSNALSVLPGFGDLLAERGICCESQEDLRVPMPQLTSSPNEDTKSAQNVPSLPLCPPQIQLQTAASASETFEALRSLPEYTRHLETLSSAPRCSPVTDPRRAITDRPDGRGMGGSKGRGRANSDARSSNADACLNSRAVEVSPSFEDCVTRISSLINDMCLIGTAVRANICTAMEERQPVPLKRSIRTQVLEISWNRLRRVRQLLAANGPQENDILDRAGDASVVSGDFFASLLRHGMAPQSSPLQRVARVYHEHASMAASALSTVISVVLQDWEGLVSVIAPISKRMLFYPSVEEVGHEREGKADFSSSFVASQCGLFHSMGIAVNDDANATGGDHGTLKVSDRALLAGTSTVLSALMSEVLGEKEAALREEGYKAMCRQASVSATLRADTVFLDLSSTLASYVWAGDMRGLHMMLLNSLTNKEDANGAEQMTNDTDGAVRYLIKLLQLGLAACLHKQHDGAGLIARTANAFRPLPTHTPTPPKELAPSLPIILPLVGCDGIADAFSPLIESSQLPTKFWGVPAELTMDTRLY